MFHLFVFLAQYLKTINKNRFSTREELERWQNKKIDRYIKWVHKHSSFYRTLWSGKDLSQLQHLPVVNKKIMMTYFDELNTVSIKKQDAFEIAFKAENTRNFSPKLNNITIGLSSGTSGNRGLFLISDKERAKWAGSILGKTLPSSLFSKDKHKIAFFLRADSNLYQTVNNRKIEFEFFDLLSPIEEHIKGLNMFQPTILVGPASLLRILAKQIEKNLLMIKPIKIISVAEVLDPLDEKYLSKVFNQTIHQIYQCTEGFMATTCEQGTLHLNEDLLHIEKKYIDESKTKFSPVITDFNRTSQPLVRYYLNDILTEKKEGCCCGSIFTAIENIEGRSDDIFYFNKQGNLEGVFPDFIRRVVMSTSDEIEEYYVKQHSPMELEVAIKVRSDSDKENIEEQLKMSINHFLSEKGMGIPVINFSTYSFVLQGKKLRRIERLFKPD